MLYPRYRRRRLKLVNFFLSNYYISVIDCHTLAKLALVVHLDLLMDFKDLHAESGPWISDTGGG